MKIFKELVNLDSFKFKARAFLSSTSKENDEYLTVHPHWHDEIEILLVLSGSAFQQVNENTFTISQGDTVVIRSQDIHATYTLVPEDMDILVVQFDSSILGCKSDNSFPDKSNITGSVNCVKSSDVTGSNSSFKSMDVIGYPKSSNVKICANDEFAHTMNLIMNEFTTGTAIPCPIKKDTGPGREFSALIKDIYNEYVANNVAKELFIISDCASLVGLCIRSFPAGATHSQNPVNIKKALEKLFVFIDENYDRPITLKEASEISNFSIPHFCRLFRQTVGMSFIDYLNHYRINKSVLLLKSENSITEISNLCGFNSINSYIRTFKKYNKLSPGEYRKAK